jgi:hypothetical protein
VHLDGLLHGSETGRDLFVELATDDVFKHFSLALGKGCQTLFD